jgi:hypothetical protein
MSESAFSSNPTYASDQGYDLSVSPDKQTFTIRFSGMEAAVDAGKSPVPVVTRVFSLVLPVEGMGDGVDISFGVSGYAFSTEGAGGYAVFSVNGDVGIEHLPPRTDNEFVHQHKFEGSGTSECSLSVFLLVERDSGHPDASAYLNVLSIDAAINPRGAAAMPVTE